MKSLKKASCIFVVITLLGMLIGCSAQKVDTEKVRAYSDAAAQRILEALQEGDYEKFSEDFDDKMKSAMNKEAFANMQNLTKQKIGDYESSEFIKAESVKGYIRTFYKAKYTSEPKDVVVTIVFTESNGGELVSGLFMNSPNLRK
jgi:hypothetical protein